MLKIVDISDIDFLDSLIWTEKLFFIPKRWSNY